MKGVIRISYKPGLNNLDGHLSQRNQDFYRNLPLERITSPIRSILRGVETEEGKEVILSTCIWDNNRSYYYYEDVPPNASLVIFPEYGEIKKFLLNPNTFFFSNAHMNVDPLIVYRIRKGWHFDEDRTEDNMWDGTWEGCTNRIGGIMAFKKSPIENPGYYKFFEFLKKEEE